MLWTSTELKSIFNLVDLPDFTVTGISIDTRFLQPGNMFFPIKGPTHDGHMFLSAAAEKGAVGAVVSKINPTLCASFIQILVPDVEVALKQLAIASRTRFQGEVIAVTGSVGKTTTKELLRHVFQNVAPTFASQASFNNQWGVPYSLANLAKEIKYGIFEVGMNHSGEIAPLSQLIQPHVALITSIAPAHIGHLGSLEAIAREKASIFQFLTQDGSAIIPYDTPVYALLKEQAFAYGVKRLISVGVSSQADVCLKSYIPQGSRAACEVEVFGEKYSFELQAPGKHMALNALMVIATAYCLNVDISLVVQQLSTFTPVMGRGQWHTVNLGNKTITLIDDAYNANLLSMEMGLRVLAQAPIAHGRRLAVLGEMLELGEFSIPHHQEVAALVKGLNLDGAFLVGGKAMQACAHALNDQCYAIVPEAEDILSILDNALQDNDVVFVKGSKGSRVNIVVKYLLDQDKTSFAKRDI